MGGQQGQETTFRRWQFAWCEFFERGRRLIVHSQSVKVEPKSADVLIQLLEAPHRDHSNDQLLGSVWPHIADGASDASLTTAIRKLRQAFGGDRDAIILNTPGKGYRIAVSVVELAEQGEAPAVFSLRKGDPIPWRPHWKADRLLGSDVPHPVWLGENRFHEIRVFKFATTLPRRRALERELTVSRYLHKALPGTRGFVRLLDSNLEEEPYFLESEYGGENLLEWSATEDFARATLSERVALTAQLVDAVAAAHSLGILHNDLKPSNVLILRDGGNGTDSDDLGHGAWSVKVIDFGLAQLTDSERLRELQITRHGFDGSAADSTGSVLGTAMYLAPEMRVPDAVPNARADVYALGVMLYQIVCGDFIEPPMPGWENRIPDPLLCEEIASAAHRDPESRTATAAELARRLGSLEERRAELQRLDMERRAREVHAAQAERDRRAAEQARVLRPWITLAMLALTAGISASLWFANRANQALKVSEKQAAVLASMNNFLVRDLLGQSNPLLGSSSGTPQQITLIDAIERVLPQIDLRFAGSEETAGRLHEAIAGALDARTDYAQAVDQFKRAAESYGTAQGELSSAAIIAEFRRENTEMRSGQANLVAEANAAYKRESALISRLPSVSPEVQGWQALAYSGTVIRGPDPGQAIPVLQKAVERGDATPGFNPSLLMNLKLRLAPIYNTVDDGAKAEQIARQVIDSVRRVDGPNSRAMFQAQMFLQEALFTQAKYDDAIAQGKLNAAAFSSALGPRNQLTLAALINTAEAEGAAERYQDATRDERPLYEIERTLTAGQFLALSTLNDIASYECRSNQFVLGTKDAHQLVVDASAASLAVFVNTANLSMAECLLAQAEQAPQQLRSKDLSEASRLLDSISVPTVSQTPGYASFESVLNIDNARLAYLEGHPKEARRLLAQAAPQLAKPQFDQFAKRCAINLQTVLARAK